MQHTLPTSSQCSLNSLVRHAFLWLVIANGIGLVMALLLLWPEWNRGPLTFARLAPLHMNLQLYGWCALPLIGLLFMAYQPDVNPSGTQLGRLALRCWSAALVVGAFSS
jgi:cytochrome c oxidase cbb3-type subunit 1